MVKKLRIHWRGNTDDVTSTVSVLTENSKLGLHIAALRVGEPHESIDGDLACQLAEALCDATASKTSILISPLE